MSASDEVTSSRMPVVSRVAVQLLHRAVVDPKRVPNKTQQQQQQQLYFACLVCL